MQYEDFVQKIRKYKRNSVLINTTKACWNINDFDGDNKILIRTQAPRIFAIAAATGNDFRNDEADIKDILSLCHKYLEIDETFSDKNFSDKEKQELEYLWFGDNMLSKYDVSKDLLHLAMEECFIIRLEQSQWNTIHTNPMISYARGWYLYKMLNEKSSKVSGFIEKIFKQKAIHAYRSVFAIWTLAQDLNKKKMHGVFEISNSTIDKNMVENYGFDLESIRVIAFKMSTNLEGMRNWHDDLKQISKFYKKYAPIPLYKTPLISDENIESLRKIEEKDFFICPSPEVYIKSTDDLFFREISNNKSYFQDIDIMSKCGDVAEDYFEVILADLFPQARRERIKPKQSQKNADFIVETDTVLFVIEMKRSLGGAEARTVCNPNDVVKMWARLLESYEQCSSTIKDVGQTDKPIIALIIIGGGNVFSIPCIFNKLACNSGILKALNLEYLEVMSLENFESLFSCEDSSRIPNAIINKWKLIQQNPMVFDNFRGRTIEQGVEQRKGDPWLRHLQLAFSELYPALAKKLFRDSY